MSTLHALLVGIDTYAPGSPVPPLRGCVNDARAVALALVQRGLVRDAELRLMVNEEATRSAVIAAWRALAEQVAPGDRIWVHFSGHGSRVRSTDAAESDGYDESLVLWDSRLPGGWDLLDKEVAVLIDEVEAKGAQMLLFLDCCHAGGATRAAHTGPGGAPAIRACPPQEAPRPAESLLGRATRGDTASSTALVVAACLETERAREHQQSSGAAPWHGALTWAFLALLDEGAGGDSWAEAFGVLSARVRSLYPQQTPQVTGPTSLALFGGESGASPPAPALSLLAVEAGETGRAARLQVDGGSALGMAPGARLLVEPSGPRATVVSCTVENAWAEVDDDAPAALAVGTRVRLLAFGGEETVAGVLAASAAVRARLRAGASPLLRPARVAEAAFLLCTHEAAEAQHWTIRAADGDLLAVIDAAAEITTQGTEGDARNEKADSSADRLLHALEHLAIVRRVRLLRNPSRTDALRDRLEVGPLLAVKPSRSTVAAFGQATALPTRYPGGPPVAEPGARLGLLLNNRGDADLYITVLALLPDWSIRRILPDDAPRRALAPGASLPLTMRAPVLPEGVSHATLRLKVLATSTPLSFDVLQLPPLLAGSIHLAAPVRAGGPLDGLLDSVRRGSAPVRSSSSDAAHALWSAFDVEVRIEAGDPPAGG
jgi:hypothetical protein